MTKLQLQNLAWTSTSKFWPNLETLCSKSGQKPNFITKLYLSNLHQTVVSTFLSINISNSNNLNKFSTWVLIKSYTLRIRYYAENKRALKWNISYLLWWKHLSRFQAWKLSSPNGDNSMVGSLILKVSYFHPTVWRSTLVLKHLWKNDRSSSRDQ